MIYPKELYESADIGTLASHTSSDPALRQISILFTNAINEILDNMLRKPLAEITKKLRDDKEARLAVPKTDIFKLAFEPKWVTDDDLKKSYLRLPKAQNPAGYDALVLLASRTEIQAVIDKIKESLKLPMSERPGYLLFGDLIQRVGNLLKYRPVPDMKCLSWFEEKTKQQVFKTTHNPQESVCYSVAIAAFQKALAAGFDIRKTAALSIPYFVRRPKNGSQVIAYDTADSKKEEIVAETVDAEGNKVVSLKPTFGIPFSYKPGNLTASQKIEIEEKKVKYRAFIQERVVFHAQEMLLEKMIEKENKRQIEGLKQGEVFVQNSTIPTEEMFILVWDNAKEPMTNMHNFARFIGKTW
jgi:hypothetical protein